MIQPPIIQRIPIPTKGKPFFRRLWILLTAPRQWKIMVDWYFTLPDGTRCVILKGFIYDGASFPRFTWWIPGMSPTDIMLIPGTIHDYGYRFDYLLLAGGEYLYSEWAGKEYWDKLFREVGLYVNDVIVIDWVAWFFVNYFGGRAWRNRRKGRPETG
ncbi:hypothetical protein LCGC14_1433320 [marine sediment metagenome]|uniref:DUF1353 domain-containing protein n=1 Tax=marine sediment metagenome TaxID=412755 RepID=A0A0F9JMV9_9ZZZZ